MILEQQVCSLELSKKLKELGVKQESLFYYRILAEHEDGYRIVFGEPVVCAEEWKYSAFTVAELGDMLKGSDLPYFNYGTGWQLPIFSNKSIYHRPKTEADARAKMLVYLLENNLIQNER
jgi:hypothetical protein